MSTPNDSTKSQRTPGPWHVTHGIIFTSGDPYGHGQMRIADIRGWGHLTGQGACAFSEDKACEIQDANAEFIVRACNAHDELLEALKLAVQISESWIHDQLDGTSSLEGALEHLKPCHAAIAKAEGRE